MVKVLMIATLLIFGQGLHAANWMSGQTDRSCNRYEPDLEIAINAMKNNIENEDGATCQIKKISEGSYALDCAADENKTWKLVFSRTLDECLETKDYFVNK